MSVCDEYMPDMLKRIDDNQTAGSNNHRDVDAQQSNGNRMWSSQGQAYKVQQWNEEVNDQRCHKEGEQLVGCMMAMVSRQKKKQFIGDEESDEDDSGFVCNMTSQSWEDIPFPIVVDSGACASVTPTN